MSTKMKGLLKGLRYISQIFDNEKEPEIMIGYPTDVKHVAHIGWDGPSVNPPTWMNEFKAPPNEADTNKENSSAINKSSEGSSRRGARTQNCQGSESQAGELSEAPKPGRRRSSTGTSSSNSESPTKIKAEKHRGSRRAASKGSTEGGADLTRPLVDDLEESPRKKQLPDMPKKTSTRKKKLSSKDSVGAARSSSRLSMSKPTHHQDDHHNNHISQRQTPNVKEERGEKMDMGQFPN